LRRKYPDDHQVVLYFASTFPCDPPMIRRFALRDLPRRRVYPMELLYIPPCVSTGNSRPRASAAPSPREA
jgi:hypothetical protein